MSRIWNIQNTYRNSLKANVLRRLKRYCFTESCKGNEEGTGTKVRKMKPYVQRSEIQLATATIKNSPFE